jgi:hypothetical protein
MIGECERCGNPLDLFAREPYLPERRSYRCFGCEHAEIDAGGGGCLRRGDVNGDCAEPGVAA